MKITKETQDKGQELMQTLVTKAWESAAFKEQLINNPHATITEVTGVKSNDVKIIVEDQTDSNIVYINIPRQVNYDNLELTDEQLEIVAGGEVLATAACLATLLMAGIMVGNALK